MKKVSALCPLCVSVSSACLLMLNMNNSSWALHKAGDGVPSRRPEVEGGFRSREGSTKAIQTAVSTWDKDAHSLGQMPGLKA